MFDTGKVGGRFIIGINTLNVYFLDLSYREKPSSYPGFAWSAGYPCSNTGHLMKNGYQQNENEEKSYAHNTIHLKTNLKTEKPRVNYCQYLYF